MRGCARPKRLVQVALQYAQRLLETGGGDLRRDILDREMRRGERDAQAAADEHHHHVVSPGARGEKFRVSGERDAGVVNDALVHGCGDHRGKMPGQAAVGGRFERLQHVGGIRRIKLPRRHRGPQRQVKDCHCARREGVAARCVRWQRMPCQTQLPRALREQAGVRDHDEFFGLRLLREQHAQVGPDTGGLAGGDGDHGRSGI